MKRNSLSLILVVLLMAGCSKAYNPIQEPLIEFDGQEESYRPDVDLSSLKPSKGTWIGIAVATVVFSGLFIYQLIEEYEMYERYNNDRRFGVETIYPHQEDPHQEDVALVDYDEQNELDWENDDLWEEEIVQHQHELLENINNQNMHGNHHQHHHPPVANHNGAVAEADGPM